MFRYIALVWNVTNEQQSRTAESLDGRLRARRWAQVFGSQGVRVFCADTGFGMLRALPLANEAGVVLGIAFERNRDVDDDSPARRAIFTARGSEAIVASQGRWLIQNCWGNYIALLRDASSGIVRVLKDPSGSLPCFETSHEDVAILFSHIGDCVQLDLRRFTVDSATLRSRVLGFNDLEDDALDGVAQIRRGECVEIDVSSRPGVRSRRFYWDPFTFVQAATIEDPQRAAAAMHATVRSCAQALAAVHANLLHRLSGGLDSSIVAGCLRRASTQPRITCYTFFNPEGRSDERPWARAAADHAGFEHLERPIAPAAVNFAELVRTRPATEPLSLLTYLLRSTVERRLAAERKATAVFTGDGGDSGFCSDSFPYAVTDYLRRHGLRPAAALRLAAQVALRTERSTGSVLLSSIRRWLFGAKMSEQLPALLLGSQLVSPQLRSAFTMPQRYPHPWFSHLGYVPWDVVRRLGTLVSTPEFYNVIDAAQPEPEIVSPLYAQPAVELFLRIPIHIHAEGGRDRGLARRAFAREVPDSILQRQWKDRAPGFHSELLLRNLDLVRELFLDGVLVKEGLLDRAAVESALAAGPSKTTVLPVEIYRHLDTEIWARYWMR